MMWRTTSKDFCEIGRNLQIIESAIGSVRATAIVDNATAKRELNSAYSAALKLSRHLDKLRRYVQEEE